MSDETPEYTPRRRLEGTLDNIQSRKGAIQTVLGANRKAPRQTIHYLQGYYDALNLVEDEVRKAKDAEIMGVTPNEGES